VIIKIDFKSFSNLQLSDLDNAKSFLTNSQFLLTLKKTVILDLVYRIKFILCTNSFVVPLEKIKSHYKFDRLWFKVLRIVLTDAYLTLC